MKRFFLSLWEGWKRVARFIGKVNSCILLFLFYIFIIGIASSIIQIARLDILGRRMKKGVDSFWNPREWVPDDMERVRRQF